MVPGVRTTSMQMLCELRPTTSENGCLIERARRNEHKLGLFGRAWHLAGSSGTRQRSSSQADEIPRSRQRRSVTSFLNSNAPGSYASSVKLAPRTDEKLLECNMRLIAILQG